MDPRYEVYIGNDIDNEIDLNKSSEDKLKHIINQNELMEGDELIEMTQINEKSPSNICKNFQQSYDNSPLFFNKSPTLDNYLLPNQDVTPDKKYSRAENEISSLNETECEFNLEKALEKINSCDNSNMSMSINMSLSKIKQENLKIENEITQEDLFNETNLVPIDRNFHNNNNFSIFILKNKIKELYNNDYTYMITPLKQFDSCEEYNYYKKLQVESEFKEIRKSIYQNFIYFPYNIKLINLLV